MKDLGTFGTAEQQQTFKRCLLYAVNWMGSMHYYTDFDVDVTWAGVTFLAKDVKCGNIEINKAVSITLGGSDPYLQQLFLITPTGKVTLSVYRANLAWSPDATLPQDVYMMFQGNLQTMLDKGGQVVLTFAVANITAGQLPRCLCSKQCNWQLFDTNCKLSAAPYTVVTSVSSFDINTRAVIIPVSKADGFFNNGTLTLAGQTYPIDKSYANLDGSHTIVLGSWPIAITAGNSITCVPGCDGWETTCTNKYANHDNFGGFAHIPDVNYTLFGP